MRASTRRNAVYRRLIDTSAQDAATHSPPQAPTVPSEVRTILWLMRELWYLLTSSSSAHLVPITFNYGGCHIASGARWRVLASITRAGRQPAFAWAHSRPSPAISRLRTLRHRVPDSPALDHGRHHGA